MYFPAEDSYFLSEVLVKLLKDKERAINKPKINSNKTIKESIINNNKIINKNKFRILDMGSGSGIQAETCLKLGFNNITCADIEEESIKYLKNKFKSTKLKIIKSNLFKKIQDKFDLIIFNPPYLKENKYDKQKDTTGGKLGDETVLYFLQQAKYHLTNQGEILLLLSSLTPQARINKLLTKIKLKKQKLAEKRIFFEKLEVWVISL